MSQVDLDGVRIGGFTVKKITSTQGRTEDDSGKITLVLEADKNEVNTGQFSFGEFLAALNIHQESQNPVVVRVLTPQAN